MGTDIHAYVAVRNGNDEWETAMLLRKNPHYDPKSDNPFYSREYELAEIWTGRNYVLFDALSNVRGRDYPAIAHSGLDDVPAEIAFEHSLWGNYCHDEGWVSLAELRRAVKDKKTYDKGDEHFGDGPHWGLKQLYRAAKAFADAWDFYHTDDDVRVYFWYDS